jgi:4-amino-4-deoxy-L-arabinose transferase-like glycosyltransferase
MTDRSARPLSADRGFTLAVALLALLPRLFVALAWAREPVWDGHSEDVLIHGHPVWKPWCHYPVGYSGLLGFAYRIFGTGLAVAPVINAVTGTLLVVVVHRLARYYLSRDRSRVAAAIVALHPGLIAYSAVVMTEPLAALLLVTAAWLAARFGQRWTGMIAGGLVLGLATLVRPSTLLAAPLFALMGPQTWWRALARGAVATLMALLVILPWTARNCRVMDGCALVSTNGGWNLAIGAVYDSGRFETLRASDGCPVVTGQVQQDRCWATVGRNAILRAPLRWLGLMPKKLGNTWDHESFAIEYLREADPTSWPEDRRVAARNLTSSFHRLLLFVASLSIVGFFGWRPRRDTASLVQLGLGALFVGLGVWATVDIRHPYYWLPTLLPLLALLPLPGAPPQGPVGRYLLALVAATNLTHAVFFGDDRYHLVVTPVLCILAAAALRDSRKRAVSAPTTLEQRSSSGAVPPREESL